MQNSVRDVGSDLAYSVATMFSQNIMARYHHFKAEMLEASRTSSSSSSASHNPQIDIPYDASVLVCIDQFFSSQFIFCLFVINVMFFVLFLFHSFTDADATSP